MNTEELGVSVGLNSCSSAKPQQALYCLCMVKIRAAKLGKLSAVCAQTDGLVSLFVTGRADLNLWGLGTPAAEGCIASSCSSLLLPWTCDPSSGYSFMFSEPHCMHIYGHGLALSLSSWTGNYTLFIETFSGKMPLESLLFPLQCDLYSNCKSLFGSLNWSLWTGVPGV